jgi:RNA polymerase sigma-70 factor, ECF subfamily
VPAFAFGLTFNEPVWERRGSVSAGAAIASAIRAHEPLLHATARRLCGNAADADDLVHDTYERALRAWDRYADSGNLKAWLMTILHNQFIDRCRRAKRQQTEAIGDDVPAPEPAPPPRWTAVTPEQLARALDQLGDEFRAVYDHHAAGRSYDEIAAALDIPKATVGTRLLRARKKLKDLLVKELEA